MKAPIRASSRRLGQWAGSCIKVALIGLVKVGIRHQEGGGHMEKNKVDIDEILIEGRWGGHGEPAKT